MRRTSENAISMGAGSQLSFQFVAVLTQLYPEFFDSVPAAEGLLISILAVAIAIPVSWGFSVYGKKKA
jgi:ABC-type phosphate transport system permease subunit